MTVSRVRAFAQLALIGAALAAFGCAKAKSALEQAAGAKVMEDADVTALKAQVQWSDTDPLYKAMAVVKGFELLDNFQGDLNQKVNIPIGVPIPEAGKDASGNQKSMLITKVVHMDVPGTKGYDRLQIISVARFDADQNALVIDGDVVNKNLDPTQIVSKANNNQTGKYLVITAKGNTGFAFLTGKIGLQRDGKAATDAEPTKDTYVFTTSSPFVTKTGSAGIYFLTMLQGSKGSVVAFKADIATAGPGAGAAATTAAPGTPTNASKDVSYSGVLDKYKDALTGKMGALGNADASSKVLGAGGYFDQVNTKVTDFLNGWKIVTSDLLFIQPKQAPPPSPTPPPAPPKTVPTPAPAPPAPPAPPAVPTPPPAAPDIVRVDPSTPPQYNVDLGCKGFDKASKSLDMVRDGAYLDDYTGHPGWRAQGDVHYDYDEAALIFALPAGTDNSRYLDLDAKGAPQLGYCLLTTSDALQQAEIADNGDGSIYAGSTTASEMWQKVQVPAAAKSIVIRAAFFSTEFPKFVGSQYNDSFFVKFDESPATLVSGNLNDLAGMNAPNITDADKAAITACSGYAYPANKGQKCGDWIFVADLAAGMHGELWDIDLATNTPKNGDTMGCLQQPTTSVNHRCWSGMIPPRTICKDLDPNDVNQLRTLRFNVTNAGDTFFPSALAVDSVEFSTKACADATKIDPPSRATQL